MQDSSTPRGGNEKTLGRKVGEAVLKISVTAAVGALLMPLTATLAPGAVIGATSLIGFLESEFFKAVQKPLSEHITTRIQGALTPADAPAPLVVGLEKHVERLLTRSAAQTILTLLREWQRLDARHKTDTKLTSELFSLDTACRTYLADSKTAEKPPQLTDWLTALDQAHFLDTPELGAAPWTRPKSALPPEPPCDFAAWFHWLYPETFQAHFADELSRDEAACKQFTLHIHRRLLDLQSLALTELAGIKDQLAEVIARTEHPDSQWLETLAGRLTVELRDWQPELVRAITADLRSTLFADLKTWAEDALRPIADIIAEAAKRIEKPTEQFHTDIETLELHNLCASWGVQPPQCPRLSWRTQLDRYAIYTIKEFGRVDLHDLLVRDDERGRVKLREIFVEPELLTLGDPKHRDLEDERKDHDNFSEKLRPKATAPANELAEQYGKETAEALGATRARGPALQVLGDPHQSLHVLLGDAGSGKSTILRLLVLLWAEDHLRRGCGRADGPEPRPVPLLTEVRVWVSAQKENAAMTLQGTHCRSQDTQYCFHPLDLHQQMLAGQVHIFADGLDEAFVPATRAELTQHILTLATSYPQMRVLVSSRGFHFDTKPWCEATLPPRGQKWCFHTVQLLDDPRIAFFLKQWHEAGAGGIAAGGRDPIAREQCRATIAGAIARFPHVRRLAVNPMLITLVCIVTAQNPVQAGSGASELSRKTLYDKAVELLLEKWDTPIIRANVHDQGYDTLPKLTASKRRSFFYAVASRMSATLEEKIRAIREWAVAEAVEGLPSELPDSNQISHDDLIPIVKYFAPEADADEVLEIIRERNYLLCFRGESTYCFIHRSFLEYFTAANWATAFNNKQLGDTQQFFDKIFLHRWQYETWHETLRFLIALLGNTDAVACLDILRKLPTIAQVGDIQGPEQEALIFAAELAQDLSPYEETFDPLMDFANPTQSPATMRQKPCDVAAKWQPELLKFARSQWDRVKTSVSEDFQRTALRGRALRALVGLWQDDAQIGAALAQFLLVKPAVWELDLQLGWAMAEIAPGHSQLFALLRDIIDARGDATLSKPPWSAVAERGTSADTALSEVAQGETALSPSAIPKKGGVALTLPAALQGAPRTPHAILAPFLAPEIATHVRQSAGYALAAGWAGDEDVKATMLRALIGNFKKDFGPDEDEEVLNIAIMSLVVFWAGDAEVKAAFLQVAIGSSENGFVPNKPEQIRAHAVVGLARHYSGDTEVRKLMKAVAANSSAHEHARWAAKAFFNYKE